jgi:hypothetical protein
MKLSPPIRLQEFTTWPHIQPAGLLINDLQGLHLFVGEHMLDRTQKYIAMPLDSV